ncbi:MAG: FecR domain-containing protein [Burkholderiaceae bacterium]
MSSNKRRLPVWPRIAFVAALCAGAAASPAGAAETAPAGVVKTVTGQAWVSSGSGEIRAVVGMPVQAGATVRTGDDGALGLTLKDNTVMSLGPRTEIALDAFVFDPGRDRLGLTLRLTRGTLNFISGLIAKLRPEAQIIRTPTGTIGVRGTHFLAKAGD